MKKLLSILLSLMILALPLCAAAETDEAFEFVFRNGIKWGDPIHTISSSEPSSGDRREYNGFMVLDYTDITVSQYTGDLTYCFADDALLSCFYMLQGDALDYLRNALATKYGEPMETDEARAVAALMALDDIEQPIIHSMWTLADETIILLFSLDGEPDLYLLYADEPALLEHANPSYELTGL